MHPRCSQGHDPHPSCVAWGRDLMPQSPPLTCHECLREVKHLLQGLVPASGSQHPTVPFTTSTPGSLVLPPQDQAPCCSCRLPAGLEQRSAEREGGKESG